MLQRCGKNYLAFLPALETFCTTSLGQQQVSVGHPAGKISVFALPCVSLQARSPPSFVPISLILLSVPISQILPL
jgi:hypothetical protein